METRKYVLNANIFLGYIFGRKFQDVAKELIAKAIIPTAKVRIHAIKMAGHGHKKSGYPEFTDCLYHSLALLNDAIFITNDKKHLAKVKNFGNIRLLSEVTINDE